MRERVTSDPSNPTAQQELTNRLGEIQARRTVSDSQKVDTLTSRGSDMTIDQGDLRLTQAIAEGIVTLKNALGDREAVNRLVAVSRERWEDELLQKVAKTEKDFKHYALGQSAKVGAIAGVSALAFGEAIRYGIYYGSIGVQEAAAWVKSWLGAKPMAAVPGEPIVERRPGPPKNVNPAEWRASYSTQVETGWYENNTPYADLNEIELHNQRVGEDAVRWDITDMTNTGSFSENNIPEVAHVEDLNQAGEIVHRLDADTTLLNDDIYVHSNAPSGSLLLEQQAGETETLRVWEGDGQWGTVPEAQLAQYAYAHDLGEFEANSNYTGFEDKFNVNVSAGTMRLVDGEWVFQSFATSVGDGTGEAIQVPTEEVVFHPGPPVPVPERPNVLIDIAVPVPISPRQALEKTRQAPSRTSGMLSYAVPPPTQRWDMLDAQAHSLDLSVNEALHGLKLEKAHFTTDERGNSRVRDEVRHRISIYLRYAETLGIPREEAEKHFKALFNYVRRLNLKTRSISESEEVHIAEIRELISNILQNNLPDPDNQLEEAIKYIALFDFWHRSTSTENIDRDKIEKLAHTYTFVSWINRLGDNSGV